MQFPQFGYFLLSFYNNIFLTAVIFENLQSESVYGLIYINNGYDVVIDNCTFKNNLNFIGLILYTNMSGCEINITNTVFDTNIGSNYDGNQMINGIILDEGANGNVYIESIAFIGIDKKLYLQLIVILISVPHHQPFYQHTIQLVIIFLVQLNHKPLIQQTCTPKDQLSVPQALALQHN